MQCRCFGGACTGEGMILGLGLDITEISRIARSWERFGMRFAKRILHPTEIAAIREPVAQFLASRFAAKEAAVKALGTGFRHGIAPVDIAVVTLPGGKPELRFYNNAAKQLVKIGASHTHLSITHGKETVAAVVIIEN